MHFRIRGLAPAPFLHLYGLSDAALREHGAQRRITDRQPGFPDRIELRDAQPGESLILLNYLHQPADTPYRSSHAIFVREGAERAADLVDEVPEVMYRRTISLRAFDREHDMRAAELADGDAIAPAIRRLLADPLVDYVHAHYAVRGCYAARIERAG
ncbi:DUF1203 domain-containing protein [Tahibacter caeni]|uniref:DUF1203 domain-containing protein n=1 Tax=Tahibacter caeni TaxID=1453545 RepID=UPI002147D877|nr:DUF1203 domain-containing protein [Tahibacter caeni]